MNKQRLALAAMILMVTFSFSGLLVLLGDINVNLTGITLLIGIVFYFITREAEEKETLSLKSVPKALKDWKTDFLILMPVVMNIICYAFAKMYLPEFLEHLSGRTDFLSTGQIIILIAELIIAALGEEIAWRGFFQSRLSRRLPFLPALFITATLFSLCHFSTGSFGVVLYDLLFIIVNAAFYGLVYKRSNNIIVSTISHFIANVVGILGLFIVK
ncbi:MAG: CPBP family intramembrane metalloprotease [Muribaculaceae bacterium]|nr:CPBP family intramembrane metalloprotease [Muribaculaceae bacterium]